VSIWLATQYVVYDKVSHATRFANSVSRFYQIASY